MILKLPLLISQLSAAQFEREDLLHKLSTRGDYYSHGQLYAWRKRSQALKRKIEDLRCQIQCHPNYDAGKDTNLKRQF